MSDHPQVRDIRQRRFFWADNDIYEEYAPQLGVHAFAVYMALCKYANADTAQCDPSVATIAKQLRVTPPTVRKALATLEDANLISIEHRPIPGKLEADTNLYTLLPVPKVLNDVSNLVNEIDNGLETKLGTVLNDVSRNNTQSNNTHRNKDIAASAATPAKATEKENLTVDPAIDRKPQPSKSVLKDLPKSSAKKVSDTPKQTSELKDAIAILCKGTVTAWNAESVAKSLAKALREVLALQPNATATDFTAFKAWWDRCDFRGQKGQRPQPTQVSGAWVEWMSSVVPAQSSAMVPHPTKPGVYIPAARAEALRKQAQHG